MTSKDTSKSVAIQQQIETEVLPPGKKKQQKVIEKLNKASLACLPPNVEGGTQGSMFVEIGAIDWFTYDGVNYLAETGSEERPKPINNLFANIKFWGETTKGIYLR